LHGGGDSYYDPNWYANTYYDNPEVIAAAPAPAPEPAWSPPAESAPAYNEPAPAYNEPAPAAPAPAGNSWEQTVNDIYQQTFDRQADESGMASFTAALNAGMTGEQMRAALASSAEGQSRGLSPAPTGIASLPAAAKPAQWELQPESYDEFTNAYNAPYYLDVNSGETKAVGQPVQATGLTPVDPNTLAQHVGPNFQGTPTQFYDEQGNLKGVLVDAVRAGLNTREGELILDPMSLGLALKPGEKASLNSALQQRNEQGQLLFIDPNTGGTTIYNTGVPAKTGSTVKDLLYINERKYGGQIPADTVQGALLLASMMATGGVGGALMNAAGLGAGAGLTTGSALADAAIQSALMQGGKTALSGGDLEAILKSAGIGAVTSAAGDLASDYFGDWAREYLGGDYVGLSDAGANELMGDYTSSPSYNDYVDYRSSGDNQQWGSDDGSGGDIEPAANKAKDSLGIQAAPQETIDAMIQNEPNFQLVQGTDTPPLSGADHPLYGTPAMPLQQEQLADLNIPVAENYDMPMVDLTAGVPEQTIFNQITANPNVPISDVLSNSTIVTLLAGGASIAAIAGIINAISGGSSGTSSGSGGGTGGGNTGGGDTGGGGSSGGSSGGGGGSGGGSGGSGGGAGEGGSEESTDDEETKKKKQQQAAAVAAIEAIAARTPPGAQIDYLYDIGGESIFAPMRQQAPKPRQDWAYEPNDRFAQGGMVAFDEGGDVTEETRALMHNPKLLQRGKDRMEREYPEDPSMVGEIAAGFHPVIGPALSAKDFKEAAEEDNYLGMGLAALGMIPIAGGAIKGYNRLVKPALRERALEKELVANYGKIPKGQPIPEGYIGGPAAPIPRFPNAESQAGYYAHPKFQTDYGREFTHDLVHSSPSPSITSFNPSVSIDNKGNRFATLNPDKARGASGNPLMAGSHAADDITTFLSNSPHYSQQYLPSNFDIPVGFPMVQGMPIPKETYTSGATMYPVSARLGNVYDPTMPEASKIANSFLDSLTQPKGMSDKDFKHYKQQFSQGLRNGEWQAIESAPFRSFLKEQGFDSFAYLKGSGKEQVKNYGVFEPNRVRGKFAEFDPAAARESDIMKASGGIIDLLRSK
jgi:hypothetical protein